MNQAFISISNQIIILFLMMVVGYASQKTNIINQNTIQGISLLIVKITLPAMILNSMLIPFSRETLSTSLQMMIISIIAYAVVILFAKIYVSITNAQGTQRSVLQFSIVFFNVYYMGFPIVLTLYGDLGIFYASVFNVPHTVLLVTYGVKLMSRDSGRNENSLSFLKTLQSPGIIAVLIGLTLFVTQLPVPAVFSQSLSLIGGVTTPLSMIIIGGILAQIPLRSLFEEKSLYLMSAVRLVIIPLIIFLLLKQLGFSGMLLGIPVLLFGMPVAVIGGSLASLYGSDYHYTSKAIFITTLGSMLTIPFWAALIQ